MCRHLLTLRFHSLLLLSNTGLVCLCLLKITFPLSFKDFYFAYIVVCVLFCVCFFFFPSSSVSALW